MVSNVFVLNTLDRVSAFIDGDPRRRSLFGDQLPLNQAPKISNTTSPLNTGFTKKVNQNGGDVIYYLDPAVNVPYPRAIFGNEIETKYETAPLTPYKELLIPKAVIRPENKYFLRDMRKQAHFRNELMASQQSWQNIHRPMFISPSQQS